jgi:hypothetical protein
MKTFYSLLLLTLLGSTTTLCFGQATTVNAGNWNTATNWSTGAVPTSTTPVVVNHAMNLTNISVQAKYIFNAASSGSATVNMSADSMIINANVSFNNSGNNLTGGVILVKSGATFTIGSFSTNGSFKLVIEPGATVIVNGSINNNGGTFQVDGTLTVNGSYSAANSSGNITGSGNFATTGSMTSMNGGTIFGNPNQSCSSNCDGTNLCGTSVLIAPSASPVCEGLTLNFGSMVTLTPTSYEWQSSTTNDGYSAISDATTDLYSTTATTSKYYRLKVVTSGCISFSAPASVTVYALPSPPSASGVTQCGGGAITLTATGASGYAWYDDALKTFLLDSDDSYTTPSLSSSASYFVTAFDVNGCESSPLQVDVTINNLPSAPVSPDVSRCGTGTVTMNVTAPSSYTYNWYLDALGSNLLNIGTSYTSPSISSNTGYYVSAVDGPCESTLTLVNVAVDACTGIISSSTEENLGLYVSEKKLYVDASGFSEPISELNMYNLQGQKMDMNMTSMNIISLDHLKTGVYLVKIQAGKNYVARRVFVE